MWIQVKWTWDSLETVPKEAHLRLYHKRLPCDCTTYLVIYVNLYSSKFEVFVKIFVWIYIQCPLESTTLDFSSKQEMKILFLVSVIFPPIYPYCPLIKLWPAVTWISDWHKKEVKLGSIKFLQFEKNYFSSFSHRVIHMLKLLSCDSTHVGFLIDKKKQKVLQGQYKEHPYKGSIPFHMQFREDFFPI